MTPILFDIDLLRRQIVNRTWLPPTGTGTVIAGCDTAFTDSVRSDRSVLCAGKVVEKDERTCLWITNVAAARTPPRELPRTIANFLLKENPAMSAFEATNGHIYLQMLLEHEFRRLDISPKITWIRANLEKGGKARRIERLVKLHKEDRVRLVSGGWIDGFIDEASRWTGTRRNCSRKDDMVDATSLLTKFII